MTWGALLRALVTDPLAWLLALIVGLLCASGGYFYGKSVQHDQTAAENAIAEVRIYKDLAVSASETADYVNAVAKDNLNEKAKNEIAADNLIGANRLRVKQTCPNLPTVAASTGESLASASEERASAVTVDFDGIARKVAELGRDYDNAVNQIEDLTKVAESYRNTCKGN